MSGDRIVFGYGSVTLVPDKSKEHRTPTPLRGLVQKSVLDKTSKEAPTGPYPVQLWAVSRT
jgi:hypothetical protein